MNKLEQETTLELPLISKKTSNEMLKKWSSQCWPSEGRKYITQDIVNNGKELLFGHNVNWIAALSSISETQHETTIRLGEKAIAVNGSRFIGGFAASVGWSMDDPESVYLSGKYLANMAKLEDFKSKMSEVAVAYGIKSLGENSGLYIEILDFLLELQKEKNRDESIKNIKGSLGDRDVQKSYRMMRSLVDVVSKRGLVFSRTTKSSILTPPNPGI